MAKRVRPTSVAALRELQPSISTREAVVLTMLHAWAHTYPTPPTAYELAKFLGSQDPNYVRPRLCNLYDKKRVTHGEKRICTVTGKLALTWLVAKPPAKAELPLADAQQQEFRL